MSDQNRYWVFTYNIRDPDDVATFSDNLQRFTRGGVYQMECGDEFQPHLQGYFEFSRTRRLAYCKANIDATCHFEPRHGTRDEAVAYCTKIDSRVEDPVHYGDLDEHQDRRADLDLATELISSGNYPEIFVQCPTVYVKFHRGLLAFQSALILPRRGLPEDKPKVWFLHGTTGTGKTRFIYEGKESASIYPKDPNNRWWDGYSGQETIAIDDYTNCSQNGLTTDYVLRLLDLYPMILEIKGGTVPLSRSSKTIVITSNSTIAELWPTHVQAMTRRIDFVIEFPIVLID